MLRPSPFLFLLMRSHAYISSFLAVSLALGSVVPCYAYALGTEVENERVSAYSADSAGNGASFGLSDDGAVLQNSLPLYASAAAAIEADSLSDSGSSGDVSLLSDDGSFSIDEFLPSNFIEQIYDPEKGLYTPEGTTAEETSEDDLTPEDGSHIPEDNDDTDLPFYVDEIGWAENGDTEGDGLQLMVPGGSGGSFIGGQGGGGGFGGSFTYSVRRSALKNGISYFGKKVWGGGGRSAWGDTATSLFSTQLYAALSAHMISDIIATLFDVAASTQNLTAAWGWNYGSSANYYTNSPAGWLRRLLLNSQEYGKLNGASSAGTYSFADLLMRIHNENKQQVTYVETGKTAYRTTAGLLGYIANLTYLDKEIDKGTRSRLLYSGRLNGQSTPYDYSAARLLAAIYNENCQEITYAQTGNTAYRTTAGVLGYIANLTYYTNKDVDTVKARLLYSGTLNGVDGESDFSVARLLARLNNSQMQEITYAETGTTGYRTTAGILGYIANLNYYGNDYVSRVASRLHYEGRLNGFTSAEDWSAARLLAAIYNQLYNLNDATRSGFSSLSEQIAAISDVRSEELASLLGQLGAMQEVSEKGFAALLEKLDNLNIAVESPEIDFSGIESRLDAIKSLLLLAGAKDILDTLVGDFDLAKAAAMSSQLESAVSSSFPFCIPAVLKQVLGLVQANAVAPSFTFDFFGAPLSFDFKDWRGLAEVTGWICRIFFVVGLLSQTNRFIFAGRSGVE